MLLYIPSMMLCRKSDTKMHMKVSVTNIGSPSELREIAPTSNSVLVAAAAAACTSR